MRQLHAVRLWCEQHAVLLLFLVSLALVGGIGFRGLQLRMDKVINARMPQHMYPAAISMLYHHGSPYLMYAEIQDRMKPMHIYVKYDEIFGEAMDEHVAVNTKLVQEAIRAPIQDPSQTRFLPGDDEGLIDITIVSLLVFGADVRGLYYTTLLIMLLTVLAFFVSFRHRADMCLVPVFLLSGLYATMPGFLLTLEVYSFSNPRVFGVLGLLPAIHLILILFDRGHFSWVRLLAAAFQVLVIVECVHVRVSVSWLIFSVVAFYMGLLAKRFLARRSAGDSSHRDFIDTLKSGWVVALLLCGFAGLKIYQERIYDGVPGSEARHRYFWHNIAIGLAVHPKFAERHELAIADCCVSAWVRRSVSRERGEVIFGAPDEALEPGTVCKNHVAYEEECKKLVLRAFLRYPWSTVELFLFYKPRLALRTLAWAEGFSEYDEAGLYIENQRIALPDAEFVADKNLHVRPLELVGFSLMLLFTCLWLRMPGKFLTALNGVFLVTLIGSYLPLASTYPLIHLIGDLLVCVSVSMIAATVTILHTLTMRFLISGAQPALSENMAPESRLAA